MGFRLVLILRNLYYQTLTSLIMKKKFSSGFWILIVIAILLNLMYLLGQTMAMIDYELTVSLGLQESVREISEVGVAFNKGFGFGDTFIYIPLFIIGIIGLLRRRSIGLYCMIGALAITAYWPAVCMSALYFAKGAKDFHFSSYPEYTVMLSLICFYGLWGMWYVVKNKEKLIA